MKKPMQRKPFKTKIKNYIERRNIIQLHKMKELSSVLQTASTVSKSNPDEESSSGKE